MAKNSKIEWCDSSWNPWVGCKKISSGCLNCYMFREQSRWGHAPTSVRRVSNRTFNSPLRWKEPAKVFTCSWSDFFIKEADQWRNEAWEIIKDTPHLTYQILTKRPERVLDCLPEDWGKGWDNVWMGVTVENRDNLWRIDKLRQIPAKVRFVSCEPLLTWVDPDLTDIDWFICGGESGPKARPMLLTWAYYLRDKCQEAGVPFFMKQIDKKRPIPADLLVREFPKEGKS